LEAAPLKPGDKAGSASFQLVPFNVDFGYQAQTEKRLSGFVRHIHAPFSFGFE
jgi:hypothetical protein